MGTQRPPYDKICRAYANASAETLGAMPRPEKTAIVPKLVTSKKKAMTELDGSFPKVEVVARGA
jgi:hypothetical protein